MTDFQQEKARLTMALRGMGVVEADVLSAIEQVPRELFVPTALRDHAYENASLPIAMEQTISQPYIVARMTAALELTGRERVLEIGTGSGYQAAILSFLCRRVYSIERLRPSGGRLDDTRPSASCLPAAAASSILSAPTIRWSFFLETASCL